jgi:sulfur carrier protein ThiS adenylyltransferase
MNDSFSFSSVISRYFTEKQYAAIRDTTVGIAGAGGLGSNCATMLVRSGFEKFVIADFDVVELSNLNRQAYTADDIGKPKVLCLKKSLERINPGLSVDARQVTLDPHNAMAIFGPCDVVVEAFDKAENKAWLVNLFLPTEKLIVSASGLAGYGNSDRIVTRRVRDNFFLIGDGSSAAGPDRKPLAPCVNIAAAKQADAVLSWVLSSLLPAARHLDPCKSQEKKDAGGAKQQIA